MGFLKDCVVPGTEPAGRNQPYKLGISAEALHLCRLSLHASWVQVFRDTPLLSFHSSLCPSGILLTLRALPHPLQSGMPVLLAAGWTQAPNTSHRSSVLSSPALEEQL